MTLDIEGVLAGHGFLPTSRPYGWCACGKSFKRDTHRTHVAAALREQIAAWLESEGTQAALATPAAEAFDEWVHRMHGVTSSCRHEIEGEAIAAAALAALAAQVAPSRVPGEGS